jgi:hypothetical protein
MWTPDLPDTEPAPTDTEPVHYFVVAVRYNNGKPTFVVDNEVHLDTDNPVWFPSTETWGRVPENRQTLDDSFVTNLNYALANITYEEPF